MRLVIMKLAEGHHKLLLKPQRTSARFLKAVDRLLEVSVTLKTKA